MAVEFEEFALEAVLLKFSGFLDFFGSLDFLVFGGGVGGEKIFGVYSFQREIEVNAIEEGSGEAAFVAREDVLRADTFLGAVMTAGTRIHGSDEENICRENNISAGALDVELATFEWLAQGLQNGTWEFIDLVEEKNPVMCERNFSGHHFVSSAEKAGGRNTLMDFAERALGDDGGFFRKKSFDRINCCDFEFFVLRHFGKKMREGATEESFSDSWRTRKQEVMMSCCCDFQRTLCFELAFDVVETGRTMGFFGECWLRISWCGLVIIFAERFEESAERIERINMDSFDHERFVEICSREENSFESLFFCVSDYWEHAADFSNFSGETELADEHIFLKCIERNFFFCGEEGDSDRKVIGRPVLSQFSGREIDGFPMQGKARTNVANSGSHPLFRFLHGAVPEPDDVESRQSTADIHFHLHYGSLESVHTGRENTNRHVSTVAERYERKLTNLLQKDELAWVRRKPGVGDFLEKCSGCDPKDGFWLRNRQRAAAFFLRPKPSLWGPAILAGFSKKSPTPGFLTDSS